MIRSRIGLRTLGVCVIAMLGLTALMAASAQASWLVGSETLSSGEKTVKVKAHTEGILSVPSKSLEILCTEVVAGASSAIKPTTILLGELQFSNCQTFQPIGTKNEKCKPKEPIKAFGKGEVFLHNGEEYGLLAADEEIAAGVFRFARVDFPETCALPDTNVSGSLVVECLNASLSSSGNCLEHTASHLVKEAANAGTLFPSDGLLYGANAATISGIANAELTSGESWSAHV